MRAQPVQFRNHALRLLFGRHGAHRQLDKVIRRVAVPDREIHRQVALVQPVGALWTIDHSFAYEPLTHQLRALQDSIASVIPGQHHRVIGARGLVGVNKDRAHHTQEERPHERHDDDQDGQVHK